MEKIYHRGGKISNRVYNRKCNQLIQKKWKKQLEANASAQENK